MPSGEIGDDEHRYESVVVGGDGKLYATSDNETLVRFNPDHSIDLEVPDTFTTVTGDLDIGTNLAADGLGNMYIVGSFHYLVLKYSPQGAYVDQFGGQAEGASDQPGKFTSPRALAIDAYGRIFVADFFDIKVFDEGGNYITRDRAERRRAVRHCGGQQGSRVRGDQPESRHTLRREAAGRQLGPWPVCRDDRRIGADADEEALCREARGGRRPRSCGRTQPERTRSGGQHARVLQQLSGHGRGIRHKIGAGVKIASLQGAATRVWHARCCATIFGFAMSRPRARRHNGRN